MRIADHWGCSLREFFERVDGPELRLWLAFYALEGYPESRADLRAALTSATIASCHGARCKVSDFVPVFEQKVSQDWREVQAWFISRAAQEKKHG